MKYKMKKKLFSNKQPTIIKYLPDLIEVQIKTLTQHLTLKKISLKLIDVNRQIIKNYNKV